MQSPGNHQVTARENEYLTLIVVKKGSRAPTASCTTEANTTHLLPISSLWALLEGRKKERKVRRKDVRTVLCALGLGSRKDVLADSSVLNGDGVDVELAAERR